MVGKQPFGDHGVGGQGSLELMHRIVAEAPTDPRSIAPGIPKALGRILLKLLEKAPEKRYQSAHGLLHDLRRLREDLLQGDTSDISFVSSLDFNIGVLDRHSQFHISEKLYDLDSQFKSLHERFERVKAFRAEDYRAPYHTGTQLVVIRGHSGSGKSSLAFRLREPVVRSGGFFTSAKFDQIKSSIPFTSLYQALSELIRHILTEPPSALAVWRKRITDALGGDAKIVADVIPNLQVVFGPGWLEGLPQPIALGPSESETRFKRLVQVSSDIERSLEETTNPLTEIYPSVRETRKAARGCAWYAKFSSIHFFQRVLTSFYQTIYSVQALQTSS